MEAFVSVVIPTYNRASVLTRSVRSVLAQTYSNLECIVVDDGSTDDTRAALSAIDDPRLRYVWQENAGACTARNHGVRLAKGDYIAFHDSDDIWHPDKIAKQMSAMAEHHADIVVCKQIQAYADGRKRLIPKHIDEGFVLPQDDIFGIGTQTVVAKKAVFSQESFDPSMPRLQDFEWLYRVLKRYRVYCVNEGLVDYLVGDDSISRSHERRYQALVLFMEKHPEVRKEYPLLSAHMVKDLLESWKAVRKNKEKNSGKYLKLACQYYPGAIRLAKAAGKCRNKRGKLV